MHPAPAATFCTGVESLGDNARLISFAIGVSLAMLVYYGGVFFFVCAALRVSWRRFQQGDFQTKPAVLPRVVLQKNVFAEVEVARASGQLQLVDTVSTYSAMTMRGIQCLTMLCSVTSVACLAAGLFEFQIYQNSSWWIVAEATLRATGDIMLFLTGAIMTTVPRAGHVYDKEDADYFDDNPEDGAMRNFNPVSIGSWRYSTLQKLIEKSHLIGVGVFAACSVAYQLMRVHRGGASTVETAFAWLCSGLTLWFLLLRGRIVPNMEPIVKIQSLPTNRKPKEGNMVKNYGSASPSKFAAPTKHMGESLPFSDLLDKDCAWAPHSAPVWLRRCCMCNKGITESGENSKHFYTCNRAMHRRFFLCCACGTKQSGPFRLRWPSAPWPALVFGSEVALVLTLIIAEMLTSWLRIRGCVASASAQWWFDSVLIWSTLLPTVSLLGFCYWKYQDYMVYLQAPSADDDRTTPETEQKLTLYTNAVLGSNEAAVNESLQDPDVMMVTALREPEKLRRMPTGLFRFPWVLTILLRSPDYDFLWRVLSNTPQVALTQHDTHPKSGLPGQVKGKKAAAGPRRNPKGKVRRDNAHKFIGLLKAFATDPQRRPKCSQLRKPTCDDGTRVDFDTFLSNFEFVKHVMDSSLNGAASCPVRHCGWTGAGDTFAQHMVDAHGVISCKESEEVAAQAALWLPLVLPTAVPPPAVLMVATEALSSAVNVAPPSSSRAKAMAGRLTGALQVSPPPQPVDSVTDFNQLFEQLHSTLSSMPSAGELRCPICQSQYAYKGNLVRHMVAKHRAEADGMGDEYSGYTQDNAAAVWARMVELNKVSRPT